MRENCVATIVKSNLCKVNKTQHLYANILILHTEMLLKFDNGSAETSNVSAFKDQLQVIIASD